MNPGLTEAGTDAETEAAAPEASDASAAPTADAPTGATVDGSTDATADAGTVTTTLTVVEDSGCSCAVASRRGSPALALLWLAVLLFRRRSARRAG